MGAIIGQSVQSSGQGGQEQPELTGIVGFVADTIDALGALGVGVLNFLDNFFPPIPSEVVLPLGGFEAAQGDINVIWAFVFATLGSVLGALILWWLGLRLGRRRTRALLTRLPLVEDEDLDRAEGWFTRHGPSAVLVGRMVPGVRSFISLPAGIERMPFWRFTVYTTVGSAAWNALLITAGWFLGRQWRDVGRYSDLINYTIIAVIVLLVVRYVYRRRHRLRGRRRTA